ncbi:MAG: NAD(P)/FAD-dependent oxidoreductase, partial [Patescibacteria group bacterium]
MIKKITDQSAKNRQSALVWHGAQKQWDVVVIGGGPAGMMAAGRAAERG